MRVTSPTAVQCIYKWCDKECKKKRECQESHETQVVLKDGVLCSPVNVAKLEGCGNTVSS